VYCWGKDLDACMRNLEAVDFLLHCELERIRLSR
jgi:methylthioribulose-1-phosphate dehydratase